MPMTGRIIVVIFIMSLEAGRKRLKLFAQALQRCFELGNPLLRATIGHAQQRS